MAGYLSFSILVLVLVSTLYCSSVSGANDTTTMNINATSDGVTTPTGPGSTASGMTTGNTATMNTMSTAPPTTSNATEGNATAMFTGTTSSQNGTTMPTNGSTSHSASPSKPGQSTSPHMTTTPKGATTGAPTSAPMSGFDGGSFVGGIALGIGICILGGVAICLFRKRRNTGYSNLGRLT